MTPNQTSTVAAEPTAAQPAAAQAAPAPSRQPREHEHKHEPSPMLAAITEHAIDEAKVRSSVEHPASGAVVIFSGVVRNHDGGQDILSLDYQAHPQAEQILAECCAAVSAETGLAVAAVHRVGHLDIGDIALSAAVSAAHRREAFEACELLVERIKSTVPIWKRQYFTDGQSEWVGL